MKAPAFWWQEEPTALAKLLAPAGAIYGGVTAWRMAQEGARAAIPIICVGNLVAGGAGKTPTALTIAAMLQAIGRKPAFLSRGHGGRLAGPILVDDAHHTAAEVGDEPMLLARQAPTIVSRDRIAGAARAKESGADVLVLDDGLQNPSLEKTLALAVVDGEVGVGNSLCIPAGPLRAPLPAQWPRIDAVLVIGPGAAGKRLAQSARAAGKPMLIGRLVPDATAGDRLRGQRVLAFAGIGRPEKFFTSLREIGAEPVMTRIFADHAPLTMADAATLLHQAAEEKLVLVTTEKDMARMSRRPELVELENSSAVLPIKLELEDDIALRALLTAALMGR